MTFLTADWRNLILAQYPVPEAVLRPYLPAGVEPDRRDGECWVSLVAFQFLNTRVLGVPWPGYRNFPEWNLRIYVRHNGRRGVLFVREFVPKWLIATIARVAYNEPYRAAPMTMAVSEQPGTITAEYGVEWAGRRHTLRAAADSAAYRPQPDSTEHFFKEHAWGYGVTHRGRLLRYEVTHPEWDVYPVREFAADVDWAKVYGPDWAFLNGVSPASVVLAVGSGVRVAPFGRAAD